MKRSILTIGLLSLAAIGQMQAITLTYDDRAEWLAQVSNLSNFDGGTQTAGGFTNFNTSAGLITTDLQIVGFNVTTGTGYDLTRVNANGSQTWYQWGSGTILRSADKTASNTVYARITFPEAVSAFGFDFGAGGSSGVPGSVTIAPDGMTSITLNSLQQPAFAFFGVASDTQTFTFADIYINDTGRYLVLDNIAQGEYQTTPETPMSETAEPATLVQLAMGGGLLALSRGRFRFTRRKES